MVEVNEFFNHSDLHQLINFLLYGKEDENKSKNTYEHRIHNASISILEKCKD